MPCAIEQDIFNRHSNLILDTKISIHIFVIHTNKQYLLNSTPLVSFQHTKHNNQNKNTVRGSHCDIKKQQQQPTTYHNKYKKEHKTYMSSLKFSTYQYLFLSTLKNSQVGSFLVFQVGNLIFERTEVLLELSTSVVCDNCCTHTHTHTHIHTPVLISCHHYNHTICDI